MLFLISKFFLIFIICFSNANAVEKKWFKKGEYSDWEVFAKADKVICYTIARPKKMEGEYNIRGRVDAMVAINSNNKQNKYYVGFDFGYYFSDNQKVKLTIDNGITFEIDTFSQTAWINPSKNPKLHIKVIEAMKKGSSSEISITHISSPDSAINLSLSLDGFTAAFDIIEPF